MYWHSYTTAFWVTHMLSEAVGKDNAQLVHHAHPSVFCCKKADQWYQTGAYIAGWGFGTSHSDSDFSTTNSFRWGCAAVFGVWPDATLQILLDWTNHTFWSLTLNSDFSLASPWEAHGANRRPAALQQWKTYFNIPAKLLKASKRSGILGPAPSGYLLLILGPCLNSLWTLWTLHQCMQQHS